MAIRQMSMRRWEELMRSADQQECDQHNGFSPGGAAAELGISRQAVMNAIHKGNLDALRVPAPNGQSFWFIRPEAIEAYRNNPVRRFGGRV